VAVQIITVNGKQFTDRFGKHGDRNGEVLSGDGRWSGRCCPSTIWPNSPPTAASPPGHPRCQPSKTARPSRWNAPVPRGGLVSLGRHRLLAAEILGGQLAHQSSDHTTGGACQGTR
jgi:hypothetical protein